MLFGKRCVFLLLSRHPTFLAFTFSLSVLFPLDAKAKDNVRLAIINKASEVKGSSDFADLMFAEFAKQKDIELIERDRINTILKEQSLSLDISAKVDSSLLVKCGKLLMADDILLMKAEQDTGGQTQIRLRLLNVRYGFKLFDSLVAVRYQQEENLALVDSTVKNVVQQMKRMNVDTSLLLPVAVTTFRSEELNPRWDWLQTALAGSIERKLVLYPGVVVMERLSAGAIVNEQELINVLPESLRPSALMIDGTYRINSAINGVSISVRARRGGQLITEVNVDGSGEQIEDICSRTANMLLSRIAGVAAKTSVDPAIEAQRLKEEASIYLRRNDDVRALPLAESAYALMPEIIEYQKFLLEAMNYRFRSMCISQTRYTWQEDFCFHALDLARKIVRTMPFPDLKSNSAIRSSHFNEIRECLNHIDYLCQYKAAGKWQGEERYKELIAAYWSFLEECRKIYAGKDNNIYANVLNQEAQSLELIQNVDELIRMAKVTIDSPDKKDSALMVGSFLRAAGKFSGDGEARAKINNYIAYLDKTNDPDVKLKIKEYNIRFSSDVLRGNEQVEKSYRERFDAGKVQKDLSPVAAIVISTQFSSDEKVNTNIRLKHLEEIFNFAYENFLIGRGDPRQWGWTGCWFADTLILSGREKDAVMWIKRLVGIIGYDRCSRDLQVKMSQLEVMDSLSTNMQPAVTVKPVPEVPQSAPAGNYKPVVVIASDDKRLLMADMNNVEFRRLLFWERSMMIVYSRGKKFGVIVLDPGGKGELSFRKSSFEYDCVSARPAVALNDGDVYLGFLDAGLLVMGKDGKSRQMNEMTGLAYNKILYLESLKDKLFAVIGSDPLKITWGPGENPLEEKNRGLMEVDLKTGDSRIITSTRAENRNSELGNKTVNGIAADPTRGVLWVLADFSLFRYDPDKMTFEKTDVEGLTKFVSHGEALRYPGGLKLFGNQLLVCLSGGLFLCDLMTMKGSTVMSGEYGSYGTSAKWKKSGFRFDDVWHAVPAKNGIFCTSPGELFEYHFGVKSGQVIPGELFQYVQVDEESSCRDDLKIRDLVLNDNGLYVLTPNAVYLVSCSELVQK